MSNQNPEETEPKPMPGALVRVIGGPYDGLVGKYERRMTRTGYFEVTLERSEGHRALPVLVSRIELVARSDET